MPTASSSFTRSEFHLPPGLSDYDTPGGIRTLYDLLEASATKNPDHVFCHQFQPGLTSRTITHSQLLHAVDVCASNLVERGLAQRSEKLSDTEVSRGAPVALLLGSDISIFIYILALTKIGNPFILVSTRLSPEAVRHLLTATKVSTVLSTDNLFQTLVIGDDGASTEAQLALAQSVNELLDATLTKGGSEVPKGDEVDHNDCSVAIFHSSGSTGLPKPIYHCHRYMLGYAANHRLPATAANMTNFSTLPLYHGFGLLAPCLSLSTGLAFGLPHAIMVPTATSTLDMLDALSARILFTVPSILEDILVQHEERGLKRLSQLEIVVSGGAPLKPGPGQRLIDSGVNVLNHFGATEFGAFAPICYAPEGYDWRFLLLRTDVPLRIGGDDIQQLTMRPFGWQKDFIVQDELEVASTKNGEVQVRIKGRVDDVVVLATGEKVNPIILENALRQHPLVNEVLVYGSGRFQAGVIIELIDTVEVDDIPETREQLWTAVEEANQKMDSHGRVEKALVIVTSRKLKPLPRTVKGNPQRRESQEVFAAEISAAFEQLEQQQASSFPPLSTEDPVKFRAALRELVSAYLPGNSSTKVNFSDTHDFFELGMDSLRALRLTRALTPTYLAVAGSKPGPDLIYANSTLQQLSAALLLWSTHGDSSEKRGERPADFAKRAVEELRTRLSQRRPAISPPATSGGAALLTGSTGSLGAQLLHALVTVPQISRVYCLNRPGDKPSKARQEAAFAQQAITLDPAAWDRIVFLEPATSVSANQLGLASDVYAQLCGSVDLIIHNAWPMDFHRPLSSFSAHVDATARLIELTYDRSAISGKPVQLSFCSSIAVIARRPGTVLEKPELDDSVPVPMGYAQAKWVCETMLRQAQAEICPRALVPTVVRIGQLTGAEGSGAWSAQEHIAAIVRSSVGIGHFPVLSGSLSWIPVNRAANALVEMALASTSTPPETGVVHLENPARQSWEEMSQIITSELKLKTLLPWAEWIERVRGADETLPASKLTRFLETDFLELGTGAVVLDTAVAQTLSPTLAASQPLTANHVREYLAYWKKIGAL
ncbi:hypothetical protein V8E36_003558 [Tilletia maclaganii]